MMNNEHERAKIFFEHKTIVHASTNAFWTNGLIIELSEKHIVIKDRKDGRERLIFFEELVKQLERFVEK